MPTYTRKPVTTGGTRGCVCHVYSSSLESSIVRRIGSVLLPVTCVFTAGLAGLLIVLAVPGLLGVGVLPLLAGDLLVGHGAGVLAAVRLLVSMLVLDVIGIVLVNFGPRPARLLRQARPGRPVVLRQVEGLGLAQKFLQLGLSGRQLLLCRHETLLLDALQIRVLGLQDRLVVRKLDAADLLRVRQPLRRRQAPFRRGRARDDRLQLCDLGGIEQATLLQVQDNIGRVESVVVVAATCDDLRQGAALLGGIRAVLEALEAVGDGLRALLRLGRVRCDGRLRCRLHCGRRRCCGRRRRLDPAVCGAATVVECPLGLAEALAAPLRGLLHALLLRAPGDPAVPSHDLFRKRTGVL
mmetsp:Transcript_148079/g.475495  ORF Transcript_148079/g.475495 Transcript_148079/m.475495 type:complete len:353 (+) Transcript_148079:142-1200(+)